MTEDEPITYRIKTVTDFLTVPPKRREDCLREFEAWLALIEFGSAVMGNMGLRVKTLPFEWIDDGLDNMGLDIDFGGTVIPVIIGTAKEISKRNKRED